MDTASKRQGLPRRKRWCLKPKQKRCAANLAQADFVLDAVPLKALEIQEEGHTSRASWQTRSTSGGDR